MSVVDLAKLALSSNVSKQGFMMEHFDRHQELNVGCIGLPRDITHGMIANR